MLTRPQYMVLNFGMAYNFQPQDYSKLTWPNHMYVDYVRVYQREGLKKKDYLSCDPPAHPTKDYIDSYVRLCTYDGKQANWIADISKRIRTPMLQHGTRPGSHSRGIVFMMAVNGLHITMRHITV